MEMYQRKIKGKKQITSSSKLAVEVPVSLTPSPPSLPTAPIHPIHLNSNIPAANLSHKQIGIELVKQQQTLQALHEKVQQVAQQQAAAQAEQQAAVQALLARNVINKSNTPIAPIDGGLLESLLPTNDDENNNKQNNKSNDKKTNNNKPSNGVQSAPNNNNEKGNNTNENKQNQKSLPPIPPIPPPLQLQTSINSVVTGAVAAAIMNSAPNANINTNIATTNTNIKQTGSNIGFNNNNINVNVAVNNNSNSHNNNAAMYYSHAPQQIPVQQLQQLQGVPMTTHIGYPPFYAPSPDQFQELPQQQYYNTNYSHHQIQRHHY